MSSDVRSPYRRGPAYRYIRPTDHLPTYDEVIGQPFDQIVAKVRLFNPSGAGTWWIAAYDPQTGVAWGVAEIQYREVGSFSMSEIAQIRGRLGLPIERDIFYRRVTIAAILEKWVTT